MRGQSTCEYECGVARDDTTSCVERLDIHPRGSRCFDLGKGLAYLGQEIRHEEKDRVGRTGDEHFRADDGNVRPRHAEAVFGR